MDNFKQRFEIIYKKYVTLFGVGCARVNERTFANFLEIPVQTVRNWRERNTVPSAKGLKAIHDKLGFAYDWLISGEGERFDAAGEKIERLEKENARLLAMVHFDGRSAEESSPDTARAAGQE